MSTFISQLVADGGTPSVQYLHFDAGNIIHQKCAGVAKIKEAEAVSPSHRYHGFSVTKTVTALAVLQLAAKGQLELDRPVKEYFSAFPYSGSITIRHLLTHTAGIPSPIPISWIHLKEEHQQFEAKAFFETIFRKHPKETFAPGTKFVYSNTGYVLLGWLLEAVTGMSYETLVEQQILRPLALQAGEISFEMPASETLARGYHKRYSMSSLLLMLLMDKKKFMGEAEGRWTPFRDFYVNGAPYGGLFGTATGFMKYVQALLRNDDTLIPANFRQQLFTENHTENGKPTGMCLSWFKGNVNGRTYYCHAGGGGGYYCELRIYPEIGRGSVLFLNRSGMRDERILDREMIDDK